METNERRALLHISNNPDESIDYLITLQGSFISNENNKPIIISISYVPGFSIVNPDSFRSYLTALSEQNWENLENIATTIIGDLSNQLVSRWICIKATASEGFYPGLGHHEILIEDRQPEWSNPNLLSLGKNIKNSS
ncbi:MAG: hypothetical protein VX923_04545 [Pseudomonadota bacterium]|nr:hypothetical protein [Pseudomonadota bacterium]